MSEPAPVRVSAFVRGHVQGVGFRWWTRSQALELGLDGFARNLPDGRVEVCAQGPPGACDELLARLEPAATGRGRPGRVAGLSADRLPAVEMPRGFRER